MILMIRRCTLLLLPVSIAMASNSARAEPNSAELSIAASPTPNVQRTEDQGNGTEERQYDSRALGPFMDGELLMMEGRYSEAASAYERALSYDSSSATIYLSLGEVLLRQGLLERSKEAGEKALELQPDDPVIYEFLARNAAARESYNEAVEYSDIWGRLDSTALEPLFMKASLLLRQDKYQETIDTYLDIYDRDPIQQQVLDQAADIAVYISDLERIYQVFRRLYLLHPDNYSIVRNYAEISIQTEHFNEAIEAYQRLDQLGGATIQTTLQLALLHVSMENLTEAQAVLAPLIDRGSRQWNVLDLSAYVADRLSDYTELARVATFMLEVYPDSIRGYTSLAIARSNQEDNPGSIEILENAMLRFPSDPAVTRLLGNMYYIANELSKAEEYLLAALELQPTENSIRHLLATTWSALEKYEASDSLYEVLLKSDKTDASAMNNYAYSLAERTEVPWRRLWYARKLSSKSLKLEPENAAFLDTYGWIWYRLRFYRMAHKYIVRSVEIRPDNPIVLDHLSDVLIKLGDVVQAGEYSGRAEQIRRDSDNSAVRVDDE